MEVFATLDVGSNSVKLHVAGRDRAGKWQVLRDQDEIARLSEGLQATGKISEAAMQRNADIICDFVAEALKLGARQILAAGTMCLRTASNAMTFIDRVNQKCGLEIEVISGEEEARLAFLGALSGLPPAAGDIGVFDIGGGSTEFIFGRDGLITERFSLNVGAVRLTEVYLQSDPVTPAELTRMLAVVDEELSGRLENMPADPSESCQVDILVGIGGTMTNLSAIKMELAAHEPEILQGSTLTAQDIDRLLEALRTKTIAERRSIVGLQPKRADVILAGTAIAKVVMQKLSAERLIVSVQGVRHGLLADRFGK
jgi:exopolyphosphatase/guanosine-5'-triphosphate,3'-diphosphate pyrophosphatase